MLPLLAAADATVLACDEPTLESITGYNFHRGCLALAYRPADLAPDALSGSRRLLGIENVANPDNIGGLFRTAAAFSVDGVLLDGTSGDPLYRKAIRTAMGASLRVPYARAAAWLPSLAALRERGFTIAALTPSAGAQILSEVAARLVGEAQLMILVGAEGSGLGGETLAAADVAVRIPIDSAVDSLNVVVAAGIALHALSGPTPGFRL
jgi:tRNA G18 (ribose-2'-O)-methylase SpoU